MPGSRPALAALVAALLAVAPLGAQPAPAPAARGPAVGDRAPDFAITGATRHGVLRDPVRLAELSGNTVIIAFFYQARTRG